MYWAASLKHYATDGRCPICEGQKNKRFFAKQIYHNIEHGPPTARVIVHQIRHAMSEKNDLLPWANINTTRGEMFCFFRLYGVLLIDGKHMPPQVISVCLLQLYSLRHFQSAPPPPPGREMSVCG